MKDIIKITLLVIISWLSINFMFVVINMREGDPESLKEKFISISTIEIKMFLIVAGLFIIANLLIKLIQSGNRHRKNNR